MYTGNEIGLAAAIYKSWIINFGNVKNWIDYPDGLSSNDEILYIKGCAKRALLLAKMFYDELRENTASLNDDV